MDDNNEVQIELTLDNGIVVDFTPDFRVQTNTGDHTEVSWRLCNGKSKANVGLLFSGISDEIPLRSSRPDRKNL